MTDRNIMGSNWWVEQINCRKRLESAQLPNLKKTTERFVAGGGWMGLDIPMEIEALTATISLKGSHEDLRKLFGREPGDWTTFYYYERLRDIMAGINIGRVVVLKGLLQEVAQPKVTGRRADMSTYTIGSIVSYLDKVNGNIVTGIDFDTNTLILDGVDYSAEANRLIAA